MHFPARLERERPERQRAIQPHARLAGAQVVALVKAGADLSGTPLSQLDAAGLRTALAAAAEAGQARAVAALVKAGADPSLPDAQTGKTPLTIAAEKGHQETVAALVHALLEAGADLSAERELPLRSYRLGDAATGELLMQCLRKGCALISLDLDSNGLTRLPPEIAKLTNLQTLSLRDNELAELPIELAELQNLKVLRLGGNPQLQTVAAIAAEKGTTAVFDYLRDLHDDPQPCFKLKVLLAGASMAGKTSIRNRLMGRAKVLAEKDTERTIGLDIAPGVALPDPQGRAPHDILLIVYDAGGHDEYQEMQQVFVTPDALNFLVWDLAKRPAEGQEEQAFQREMVAQQVHWAQIIQSCAPGSTVRSLSTLALLCFGQSVGSSDSILLPLPCSVPILCVRFLCSVFSGLCLSGSAISALFFFTSIPKHVPSLHCPVS